MENKVLQKYFKESGLSLEYMKEKVSPNFAEFLSGKKEPTFNQKMKIAKQFDIPVGLLLIDKPVERKISELKFRTINSESITVRSLELTDTISEMEEKQDFLKNQIDYSLDFINKFSINDDFMEVANYARNILNIKKDYYNSITKDKQLRYLRNRVNRAGVFVFFNGKIGDNTHRSLSVDEFRGFVLIDDKAPLIFINQKDTRNGQVFTLLHEFTHLLIGDEEILGKQSYNTDFDKVEAFVNKVTAELLVPVANFEKAYNDLYKLKADDFTNLVELSKLFKVSEYVIARRMLDTDKITHDKYLKIIDKLTQNYLNYQKEATNKSGGNYNNNLNFRMDKNFFQYVERALNENKISYTDAFNIVGVGYKGYQTLKKG